MKGKGVTMLGALTQLIILLSLAPSAQALLWPFMFTTTVKEISMLERIHTIYNSASSFIYNRYFDAYATIQEIIFINYLSSLNLIIIIGALCIILYYSAKLIQGRHRTHNNVVPPANQTAANALHIYNSLQFGPSHEV